MHKIARTIDHGIEPLRGIAAQIGSPLIDLTARLYLGYAFFKSGTTRFHDWWNGNFDSQVFLFELEHPVPGLSPEMAAYMATFGEILLPVLLVLGLFSRFAAAGLLIMTAVIEFTYGHFAVHVTWAFLAAFIFIKGPGPLSLDYLLLRWIRRGEASKV